MDKKNLASHINLLVRARRHALATKEIRRYLKINKNSIESRVEACEWLRRLSSFLEAYRVIAPDEFRLGSARLNRTLTTQYLWSARMLNLLGAYPYAVRMAEEIKNLNSYSECRMMAFIYLVNWDYPKALFYFRKMEELDETPDSHLSKGGRVGTADALMGIGDAKAALKHVKKIPLLQNEPILRSACLFAEGEYLIRSGQYEKALPCLETALQLYPEEEIPAQTAIMMKWVAVAHAGAGRVELAAKKFEEVISHLYRPYNRAESWLDCYYWMDQFGLLSVERKKEWFAYPGLAAAFSSRIKRPARFQIGSEDSEIWVSLTTQEWKYKGKHSSAIPKEIIFLSLLARSGKIGISVFRILPEIWPDELAIHQLLRRVQQLRAELKKRFKIKIDFKDNVLTLSPADLKRVGVELWSDSPVPSVFHEREALGLDEVQAHYQIKRTQCHHLVKSWEEKGWVKVQKTGRNVVLKRVNNKGAE